MADERAVTRAVVGLEFGERDDLIYDAGQLEAGLGTVDLQREDAAIEVIELLVEDADEPDVLAARVLKVGEPGDHLLAHQAVGTAAVGLAGLLGESLRPSFAPLQAEPPGDGDRVDKHGVVAVEDRCFADACADCIEVRLAVRLIFAQRRVRPTDVHREVTTFLPGARAEGVTGPALDRQVAGLEVEEQRCRRFEGPQLRRLADPALADEDALDAALFCEALVGADDGEAHSISPLSRARRNPGLPVLRVRAGTKALLSESGHALNLVSEMR